MTGQERIHVTLRLHPGSDVDIGPWGGLSSGVCPPLRLGKGRNLSHRSSTGVDVLGAVLRDLRPVRILHNQSPDVQLCSSHGGVNATHRVTDQHWPVQPQRLSQPDQIAYVQLNGVAGRTVGCAVPTRVVADDVI